jgi:hypothetical protein
MSGSLVNSTAFIEAAADRVARSIASMQRDAARERELRDAQFAARLAELETRIASVAELERKLADRLATVKDGEPGPEGRPGADGARGADGVSITAEDLGPTIREYVDVGINGVMSAMRTALAEAVAALPAPRDGRDVDPEDVRQMVTDAVAALPPAQPGRDADPAAVAALVAQEVERAVAAIPAPQRGEPGPMGALPVVKAWEDRVYYEGEVCEKDGSLFQARKDTGKEPDHEDWSCIVRRGKDGADGRSFTVRETWASDGEYRALDVVALNGASFVARVDNPGPCPGEGWQLMSMQGKQGKPGEPGRKGDTGHVRAIAAARVSDDGLLTLINADGSTVECDLYPILSRLG